MLVRYASAKVVLLGNSGVGKSGLARVLRGDPFAATTSTHGMVMSVLRSETTIERGIETVRETILWDLAGQPDYRIVHQLFLSHTTVALVVVDPTSDEWSQVAREWNQGIVNLAGDKCRRILVLARVDVGGPRVAEDRIAQIVESNGFAGYCITSAKTGEGIEELLDTIQGAISWGDLSLTMAPQRWMRATRAIRNRAATAVVASIEEIEQDGAFSFDSKEELDAFLALRELHGELWRLRTAEYVLLRIDYLNNYASLIVLEARRHPEGLGCVVLSDVLEGRLPKGGERLADTGTDHLLLRESVALLLSSGMALREGRHLLLPGVVSRDEGGSLTEPFEAASEFTFEGSLETVYAALATRLAYSAVFELEGLYRDSARFRDPLGRLCRFELRRIGQNRGFLALSFQPDTPLETRALFGQFVLEHLKARAVPGSIREDRIIACRACGHRLEPVVIRKRLEMERTDAVCPVCDERIPLEIGLEKSVNADRLRAGIQRFGRRADELIHNAVELLQRESDTKRLPKVGGSSDYAALNELSAGLHLEAAIPPAYDAFFSYSRKDGVGARGRGIH